MKIETVIKKFAGSEKLLRCPICKSALTLKNSGSFICTHGHCFDLSSKGYVNFLTDNQGDSRYGKELFENRKAVFRAGFYENIARATEELTARFLPADKNTVLDAGCGDGYYSLRLAQTQAAKVYAVDNSKEAILSACKSAGDVRFMVADLADLPVLSNTVGALINILTPANYTEFARVLGTRGILIKAIPGENYLRELRECVGAELLNKEYSNQRVIDRMKESTDIAEQKSIEYTLPVNAAELAAFYKMTPMTTRVDIHNADLTRIKNITIHMEIIAAFCRQI
ncbi:MAG: methyltransferase domain-containing protein [Christensenella sp.]